MEQQANNRLQPCLLQRLTDDDPKNRNETRSDRVVSLSKYKESVLRDLTWLFNTSAHIEGEPIHDHTDVRSSVINFGIRDLAGYVTDSLDLDAYRRQLIEALLAFEPRLNRHKLDVQFISDRDAGYSRGRKGTLRFEITGELYAYPVPERFLARSQIDMETGRCFLA